MLNSVMLCGRIPFDIKFEEYSNKNGDSVYAKFTLSVRRDYKEKGAKYAEEDLISCIAFGQPAEFLEKLEDTSGYYNVQGRLQVKKYLDEDDNKRILTSVIVEKIYALNLGQNTNTDSDNDKGQKNSKSNNKNNSNDKKNSSTNRNNKKNDFKEDDFPDIDFPDIDFQD